ncbi:hypothetical protein TorRG33x02_308340, partial [Trema orientale]
KNKKPRPLSGPKSPNGRNHPSLFTFMTLACHGGTILSFRSGLSSTLQNFVGISYGLYGGSQTPRKSGKRRESGQLKIPREKYKIRAKNILFLLFNSFGLQIYGYR